MSQSECLQHLLHVIQVRLEFMIRQVLEHLLDVNPSFEDWSWLEHQTLHHALRKWIGAKKWAQGCVDSPPASRRSQHKGLTQPRGPLFVFLLYFSMLLLYLTIFSPNTTPSSAYIAESTFSHLGWQHRLKVPIAAGQKETLFIVIASVSFHPVEKIFVSHGEIWTSVHLLI